MPAETKLHAVSLFTNCGAGDVGYAGAGFTFDVMAELLKDRLAVAELNHPGVTPIGGDLRATLPKVISGWRERHGTRSPDLLAACPPCQGMSTARGNRGADADVEAGERDPRNLLVEVIADAADELQPRAIVVENVYAFLTRKVKHPVTGLPVSAAAYLRSRLADAYEGFAMASDLADFGVPQSRRRSFLTFLRRGEAALSMLEDRGLVPFPAPTHAAEPITVQHALEAAELARLDAASLDTAISPDDPYHRVPVWTTDRYQIIAAIPPHTGASAWENDACPECDSVGIARELPRCPECNALLLRPVVQDGKDYRLITGFPTSYARMPAGRPATTITTASGRVGSDYTIHPWENRVLSMRECLILQTFPETFDWGDTLERFGHTRLRAMIGEAVPPVFTRRHGQILATLLRGKRPKLCMAADDARVARAQASLDRAKAQTLALG